MTEKADMASKRPLQKWAWVIGGVVGLIFLIVLVSGLAASGAGDPEVISIGWPADATTVRQRLLLEQLIEERDGDWSPVITEGDRRYRAIWYAPHDRDWDVRVWLDDSGRIDQISATGPTGDEFIMQGYAEQVLGAAAPGIPLAERKNAAQSISKLLRPGGKAELSVGPITLRGTSGYTHMTMWAKPAT